MQLPRPRPHPRLRALSLKSPPDSRARAKRPPNSSSSSSNSRTQRALQRPDLLLLLPSEPSPPSSRRLRGAGNGTTNSERRRRRRGAQQAPTQSPPRRLRRLRAPARPGPQAREPRKAEGAPTADTCWCSGGDDCCVRSNQADVIAQMLASQQEVLRQLTALKLQLPTAGSKRSHNRSCCAVTRSRHCCCCCYRGACCRFVARSAHAQAHAAPPDERRRCWTPLPPTPACACPLPRLVPGAGDWHSVGSPRCQPLPFDARCCGGGLRLRPQHHRSQGRLCVPFDRRLQAAPSEQHLQPGGDDLHA